MRNGSREPDVLVDLTPLDTDSRYSGTGRYVRELGCSIAALSERERQGLTIGGLVALDGDGAIGPLDWNGSPDVRWPLSREMPWLMARRFRLRRTLLRTRPGLFHATYSPGTPRFTGVPRVVTCLDLVPLVLNDQYLPGRPLYRGALFAAEALRFHTARRVLAISNHTADELMRVLRVPSSKIDVADLGVDLVRYHRFAGDEVRQVEAARRKYKLELPYIFYIGAADPRKNVDVLLAAFAKARMDDLELVLIGRPRPSDQRTFDRAVEMAGRPRGVRFLGFVPEEDLPAVMAGGIAFVCCSTHEGFPYVHLGAMACACPVITPGVTSMRDTVADASLVVPPRDAAATADAIRRVVGERGLRDQLAGAGLRCAARFSLKNTALATVECYVRALA
jgi:glycosyltransferase involved in cell wall biosynthesis